MATLDLSAIELKDPDVYVDGVPHASFRALREHDPVHWHPESDGPGFWAITKHADLVAISKDPRRFSSAARFIYYEEIDEESMAIRRSMIETDPPEHTRLRRIVSPLFTPKMVDDYRGHARAVADRLLDRAVERGSFDWVRDICEMMPIRVFVDVFGAPEADADYLAKLANMLVAVDDPDLAPPPEMYAAARARGFEPHHLPFSSPAALELFDYAQALCDARRAEPRDDLITRLVQAEWEGDRLTDNELVNFCQLLVFAGNETTRNSLATGMHRFIEQPDQLDLLDRDRTLMRGAVEEVLRWATPIYAFRRTATEDVELRGQAIRAGDKLMLYYISANFDEEVFPDPERFDVTRDASQQVVFGGGGPHYCLGAFLARMQVETLFTAVLDRGLRFAVDGPTARLRSNFGNGFKTLPVRVVAGR
ncbi:MAG: cytochrome P450 [Actinobacteria bacterium]|nr:cytochrome P450 [Actinomycetota bacterium]